ncbi:MAG: hypothetical protein J5I99_06590 [Verrucomicrobia bacterium]|nr:hypothetical protein [Kiritimatiellia bacterium]MCO6400874.1 hypothetical protein [Verrucomicrobiota bacterium]
MTLFILQNFLDTTKSLRILTIPSLLFRVQQGRRPPAGFFSGTDIQGLTLRGLSAGVHVDCSVALKLPQIE